MTLEFKKLIINNIKKQMRIQHYDANVQLFKRDEIPEFVTNKIQKDFGQNYLLDADYLLFFSKKGLTKDEVEKSVFKVVNAALGESANNSNPSDFKMFSLEQVSVDQKVPDKTIDDVDSLVDTDSDDVNNKVIDNIISSGSSDDDDDEEEIEKEINAEIESSDDEDDEEDDVINEEIKSELDESVDSPEEGEKFVFVKITMK